MNLKYSVAFRILCLIIFLSVRTSYSQRDNVWVWGDSVRLDFNKPGVIGQCHMRANWGSACISDTSGNLLYYIGSCNNVGETSNKLYDFQDSVLYNGDSILNFNGIHFNTFISYLETDSDHHKL